MSAYTGLLAELSCHEPRGGWSDVADLPDLSDAELAAVVEENDVLPVEAADQYAFCERVLAELRSGDTALGCAARIGAAYVLELQSVAKHYVLHDLRREADRRYYEAADEARHEAQYRDAQGLAADEAGVAAAGEI